MTRVDLADKTKKYCPMCEKIKDRETDFHPHKSIGVNSVSPYCKECTPKYHAAHRLNPTLFKNKKSSAFLGAVTEQAVAEVVGAIPVKYGTPYIDGICRLEKTFNAKSSNLRKSTKTSVTKGYSFQIYGNKNADYFICIGLDRDTSTIHYVWVIPGRDIGMYEKIAITPGKKTWDEYTKYLRPDLVPRIQERVTARLAELK